MLRVARLLTRSPRVRYLEGTAEALPLPDDAATLVWSIASVHHWRDLDIGLQEIRRVLRPAGRFVAIERATRPGATGHASHGWTDEQAGAFAQRCREHDLTDVRVHHDRASARRSLVAVTASLPEHS
jgi:ubiquinone/menaquinone biosynthesis C-methylase UbiE